MGRWLLGLLITGVIALVLALVGPLSAEKRSQMMETSINEAMNASDISGVDVKMKGHKAVLSGPAMTEESLNSIITLAENAKCDGCSNSNPKWHEVISKIELKDPEPIVPEIPTVERYTFSATKRADGSVLLDGFVPSDEDRMRILNEAESLFPNNVENDEVTVALGAPNAGWTDAISKYLVAIAPLDRANVTLDGLEVLVTGLTTDEAVRNRINSLSNEVVSGYSEIINITVPDAPSAFTGTVQSQTLCQTLFNQLKGDTKINFATGSAELAPESFGLLNRLSTATQQCPAFRVMIEGHTDNTGDRDFNMQLSKSRADSVSDYLVRQGVSIDRMSSAGYGPDRPVASNETVEGQAANRRIEFIVTTSE